MRHELRACAALLLVTSTVAAGDWAQWLGPRRDGSSSETVKPWQGPLKVLWKQPVGEGHSSPVVAGGRVYLHTRLGDKSVEAVTAYDARTGAPQWQTSYPPGEFKSLFGNGPRGTPTVVGGKVYTFGITGILTCLDAETGKQLWQVDTLKKYQAANLFFGASCSPLVDEGLVFVNVGGKGASIVALAADTGELRWQALDDKASYSSPIALTQGGRRAVVFLTARGLVALAPSDGAVLWQHALVDLLAESSTTPVVAGDILFGSSITYGGVGLRLLSPAAVQQEWQKPELNCYFSTPVAVGKQHLYVVTGTKPPALVTKATLRCIEAATGKELWNRDKVGTYHASLLRTGDDKLLLVEEPGNLVLLQPDPKEYRELARSKICGNTWAHLALADGRLYIRDGKELVCVDLSTP
jgi:outer membrane protein assembly factor BamB